MRSFSTGIRIKKETRQRSNFALGDKHYRLSYTSRESNERAAIQINQPLRDALPVVERIIGLRRYRILRVLINREHQHDGDPDIRKGTDGAPATGGRGMSTDDTRDRLVEAARRSGYAVGEDSRPPEPGYAPLLYLERCDIGTI